MSFLVNPVPGDFALPPRTKKTGYAAEPGTGPQGEPAVYVHINTLGPREGRTFFRFAGETGSEMIVKRHLCRTHGLAAQVKPPPPVSSETLKEGR